MAGSAGSIFVDLLLRDANFRQGVSRARRETGNFANGASSDLRKTQQAFQSVINPVNNLASAIAGLGIGIASYLSADKIIQISDAYIGLESRLSIVIEDNKQLVETQEELYNIAIRTRQPLENVYNLYTRLAQALPESQRGQFNLLEITESINQALAITGEGSAQAASAVLQFTQAAASGFQASGQEINALLDSAPRLARVIQQSFGDGTTSLKQLSEEGQLSTEAIFRALEKTSGQAQILGEEFSKAELTVGQALNNLETAFTEFIGQNSAARGVTTALAEQIQALADNFSDLDAAINKAVFSLQKFTSQGGDGSIITPEMFEQALPPEYTQYSEGDIQAALDLAKRMDEALKNPIETKEQKKARQEAEREAKRNQKELESLYEKNRELITGIDRETLNYIETEKELNRLYAEKKITLDQLVTALYNLDEKYDETSEKVNAFGVDSEQFAKRAAENIQDAFAEFLFDPFESGLDGMAKGFVDTIRKMIAEAQAAQLAKYIFGEIAGGSGPGIFGDIFGSTSGSASGGGIFDGIGKFFGGFFADGGFLQPGQWGIAGENGPEPIFGGNTGMTVIPNGGNKGGNTYNIDARGADQGAVVRLEQSILALAGPGVIERRVNNAQSRGKI